MSNSLRNHYISNGAIIPDQPTRWTSSLPTLALDTAGIFAAQRHIEEDSLAAMHNELCDIPLDQVPDFVLEAWGL